jgi:hypothetical protein
MTPSDYIQGFAAVVTLLLAVSAFWGVWESRKSVKVTKSLVEQATQQTQLVWESTAPRVAPIGAAWPSQLTIKHTSGSIAASMVTCWVVHPGDQVSRVDMGQLEVGAQVTLSLNLTDREKADCPESLPLGLSVPWICIRWYGPGSAEHRGHWSDPGQTFIPGGYKVTIHQPPASIDTKPRPPFYVWVPGKSQVPK